MPTLDLIKNRQYVAKSRAKKRAQRIEAERKRIYRGKKKASKGS